MRTFKRVTGWFLLVVAVSGIIAILIGIVASWNVRNRVTEITVNLLTVGETAVNTVNAGLGRISDRLDTTLENVQTLETNLTSVGEDLTENSLVREAISANISEETAASISEARATAVTIQEAVIALDETIATVNQLPFVELDGFAVGLVSDLANGLIALEQEITTLRTGIQDRREERIGDTMAFFTGITSQISGRIGEAQSKVNDVQARLTTTSDKMAAAKESLPGIFTILTIGADVILLLVGVAFGSLLLHGWELAKKRDNAPEKASASASSDAGQTAAG
jgi:hypothetical protein